MDQPVSRQTLNLRNRSTFFKIGGGVLAVVATVATVNRLVSPNVALSEIRVAEVKQGGIANTVNASGIVIPMHEELISSPIQSRVTATHVKPGQEVAAGELLLELDDSTIRLAIDSLREQIAQQDNRVEGLSLEQLQKKKQLDSEIELLSLDLERNKVELDRRQRLGALGATSASDLSAAELAVKRAVIQLRQHRESITDSQLSTQSSIEGARLQKSILEKQLQQQLELQAQTQVKAPFAGMVSWLLTEEGSSVSTGQMVAKVSELANFGVEASVSDFYARYLSPGQSVRVEYSGQTLSGEVRMILPEIQNGTVKLMVDLDQPNHPLLRNKLRVETNIITEQKANTLVADNGPAFNGKGRQEVYVLSSGHAVKTMVEVGLGDGKQVEIVSGLKLGDRLIISDTSGFKHLDSISVSN
jgi:HlyD family secretion protein